jgi:AraC-like DNA-binding protein
VKGDEKGDEMSDRLFFSTDTLPERDRFPAFCEEMFRHIIGADIVQLGSMPFRGMLEIRRASAVGIANISTTSADMIRNESHISDGNDAIVVQLWQQGLAGTTHGKHENQIKAREGLIIDNTKAARVCAEDASQFWALTIPRNRVIGLRPDANRFAGTKLRDDLPLRLLFGYLKGTQDVDLSGDRPAVQLYDEHIIDLISLALGAEGEAREFVEQRGVAAVRRAAILHAIENGMRDPNLSATAIASQFGITPRYLRLLLEETGRSFSQHVLEKRLERASKLLRDPRQQDQKISAIALACGFGDLSYFNQTFRRRYGETPSDVRETTRRQNRD